MPSTASAAPGYILKFSALDLMDAVFVLFVLLGALYIGRKVIVLLEIVKDAILKIKYDIDEVNSRLSRMDVVVSDINKNVELIQTVKEFIVPLQQINGTVSEASHKFSKSLDEFSANVRNLDATITDIKKSAVTLEKTIVDGTSMIAAMTVKLSGEVKSAK
ncbi:MAG TPA: hypothetical protein PKK26_19035 [Candidatus Wallbacteria bacterium]|nr:hypothetical protein [Candidatus Wallbacteria bacterium]